MGLGVVWMLVSPLTVMKIQPLRLYECQFSHPLNGDDINGTRLTELPCRLNEIRWEKYLAEYLLYHQWSKNVNIRRGDCHGA